MQEGKRIENRRGEERKRNALEGEMRLGVIDQGREIDCGREPGK